MKEDLTLYLNAIRKNDQEAFLQQLESSAPSAAWLDQHQNETRYASWFSGIGFTLLQLTSFLKPGWASCLVDRGVTIDLHSACALGDTETIYRITLESPEAIDRAIDTYYPSQFAIRQPEALRALFTNGDNPNRPLKKLAWFDWEDAAAEKGSSDWRLIHMLSVGRGKPAGAEALKAFGADLSASSGPFGDTGIHLAAIYDRTDIIRWFVENGVDVDSPSAEGGQDGATTDLFENEPFKPFKGHGTTPLMCALGEGQSNAAKLLLDLGANVKARNSYGFTPLHYAAGAFWQENEAHVNFLLEQGADPTATDSEGRRPADLAVAKGYEATRLRLASEA